MPVVEPVVNEEKLRQLLAEQHESELLDYKRKCDLASTPDLIELAKDIGAMQVDGGFIVVGADDHGNPTSDLTQPAARLYDEATIRAKVRRYLPPQLDLRAAVHLLDGRYLAVLAVGPNPYGFAIFASDGISQEPQANGKTRETVVFRKGDVFVRHGSASERWEQADVDRIRDRIIAAEKEKWRREYAEVVRAEVGRAAQDIARGPADALDWRLDEATFLAVIVEQLRTGDDIPMRLLLSRAPQDAIGLAARPDGKAELGTLLDRLVCVAAITLEVDRRPLFDETVRAVGDVYDAGYELEGKQQGPAIRAPEFWLMVIERIYALGALAIRREDWEAVRRLALHRPNPPQQPSYYPTWLRHALTMAARSNLFREQQGDKAVELSLLSLARRHADREECLRRGLQPEDERILDSLCQFDALAALAAIASTKSMNDRAFYTSFARFYSHRTEPAIARLIENPEMRRVIFPLDDQSLADALRLLSSLASREGFNYAGWEGFMNPVVTRFLEEYPPKTAG